MNAWCKGRRLAVSALLLALIHPSAWRDCLETPNRLHYGVLRVCGTRRMSIFSGAWRHQKTPDPTLTATFQTVSLHRPGRPGTEGDHHPFIVHSSAKARVRKGQGYVPGTFPLRAFP